jgi:hypothetical protein
MKPHLQKTGPVATMVAPIVTTIRPRTDRTGKTKYFFVISTLNYSSNRSRSKTERTLNRGLRPSPISGFTPPSTIPDVLAIVVTN